MMQNPLVIENDDESMVIITAENHATIVSIEGNAMNNPYAHEIINYDGGHADTKYGDLPHLDGGGGR